MKSPKWSLLKGLTSERGPRIRRGERRRTRLQSAFERLENRHLLAAMITQVNYFDTWDGGVIRSTDVAGIAYHPPSGHLYLADSEINELPEFVGDNVFETSLAGDQVFREIASNNPEPTGITYNAFDNYFYVTRDTGPKSVTRYDINLNNPLLVINTPDDVPSATDPEGITSDPATGNIYVSDGNGGGKQILAYDSNLQFQYVFSVASQGDAEGIAFHEPSGHLFVIDGTSDIIFEYTVTGTYIEQYDIGGFSPSPKSPQGLTFAPTSDPFDDPSALALYIADGMVDNFPDGRVYEAVIGMTENQAPVARDDSVNTDPNSAITIDVLADNGSGADSDGDGTLVPATTTATSVPTDGTLVNNGDGTFLYTPDLGFLGADSFTYTVKDEDGAVSNVATVTITTAVPPSGPILYFSLRSGDTLPGAVTVAKEDIIGWDGTDFSVVFDGSDVGLSGANLDALAVLNANEILFSMASAEAVPGIPGTVDDSDIVKFTATQLGDTTVGTFELYFDGSDVGLDTSSDDVDALDILVDGRLVMSTKGSFSVPGVTGRDEDLIAFTPTSLGDATTGTWAMYFDGSDVELGGEDINGASLDNNGNLNLSTNSDFAVTGLVGEDEDVLVFMPSSLGDVTAGTYNPTILFDGSLFGLVLDNDVFAVDIPTSAGPPNNPPTGSVTITGTATEDEILTASNTLADEDGLGAIGYQWQRGGVDIPGAVGGTYTLVQADVGSVIRVVASYTDGQGTAESVASADTAAVTNVNDLPTGAVTIAGTATEDEILTAAHTLADEDGLGAIGYQWQRNGVDIPGAVGGTYTLVQADVGSVIRVVASYTDGQGTAESVASADTAAVTNVNDLPTGAVTIAGTATEDEILTAAHTLADEDGLGAIGYQWQRGGVDIPGAVGGTYTLVQADVGSVIRVVASYTDGQGTAESVASAPTAAVVNVNDLPSGSVAITGTAAEDEILTASNTLVDEDGLGPIGYQWQRGGADIPGAVGVTYTLVQADVGSVIRVVAGYTDGQGTAESVASAPRQRSRM